MEVAIGEGRASDLRFQTLLRRMNFPGEVALTCLRVGRRIAGNAGGDRGAIPRNGDEELGTDVPQLRAQSASFVGI